MSAGRSAHASATVSATASATASATTSATASATTSATPSVTASSMSKRKALDYHAAVNKRIKLFFHGDASRGKYEKNPPE